MTQHAEIDLTALTERFSRIPISDTLSLRLLQAEPGNTSMVLPYAKRFDGVFNSLHGGLLMTLADTAACAAIMTLVGVDAAIATTDMNIRFLAACRSDCVAQARVIKCGRSLVPVAVDLYDENGARVAVAQVTYMRLDLHDQKS